MDDLIHRLLFYDDLTPEERRAALAEALSHAEGESADGGDTESDEAAPLRALRRWERVRRHVGERFREALPARRLLVLHALAADAPGTLSEAEREELDAARPQIEAALDRHPALGDVLGEIRRERDAFETAWEEHAAEADSPERDGEAAPPARSDAPGNAGNPRRRAADRAAGRTTRPSKPNRSPKRRPVQRWGGRIAAVLALVAFCAVLFFVFQRDQSTITVTAEAGAPRLVELADGSTVRLAPGATLSYVDPEAGAVLDRQATLEAGRAFFDIVPSQEGFVVETPTAQITVLGTRFDVQIGEGNGGVPGRQATRVVLASGRVALAAREGGQPVSLAPGQASRVAAGARPTTPTRVESLSDALAWTGQFFFRETPARQLARQLAVHYGQTVEVAPPLRDQEVTGTFDRDRPLRETLSTVAAALDARLEPIPGGYALVPDGP